MMAPNHQVRGWSFLAICLTAGLVVYLLIKQPGGAVVSVNTTEKVEANSDTLGVDDDNTTEESRMIYGDDMRDAARAELQAEENNEAASQVGTDAAATASIWADGSSVIGTCEANVNGVQLMSGACSGAGHGSTVFVTAQRVGCSIELERTPKGLTGKIFAYKDECGNLEGDVDLGIFQEDSGCLVARSARVCLQPAAATPE